MIISVDTFWRSLPLGFATSLGHVPLIEAKGTRHHGLLGHSRNVGQTETDMGRPEWTPPTSLPLSHAYSAAFKKRPCVLDRHAESFCCMSWTTWTASVSADMFIGLLGAAEREGEKSCKRRSVWCLWQRAVAASLPCLKAEWTAVQPIRPDRGRTKIAQGKRDSLS